MKLEPKARPVQISKLNLGGKDINSLQDLSENFYVDEIIRLGEKFYTWLRRHDADKAQQVKSIFDNESSKDDEKACLLIKALMPGYQKIELNNLPETWLKDKNISQQAKNSFLKCYEQNIQIAIELLSKDIPYDILEDFLVECESCEETDGLYPEFCYQYGLHLKNKFIEKSYYWVKKASDKGHAEASKKLNEYILETPDRVLEVYSCIKELIFRVGKSKIKMIRVKTSRETFFIAEDVLNENFFRNINGCYDFNRSNLIEYWKGSANLSVINGLKKILPPEIEDATWDLPTINQWQLADALKLLKMPQDGDLEWTNCTCGFMGRYVKAISHGMLVEAYSDYDRGGTILHLRPVINIKMKKS